MKAKFTLSIRTSWEPKTRRKAEIELPNEVADAVLEVQKDGHERIVRPDKSLPLIWLVEPQNPCTKESEDHNKYSDVTITAFTGMQQMGILLDGEAKV